MNQPESVALTPSGNPNRSGETVSPRPAIERRQRDRGIARCHAGLLDTSFLNFDCRLDATMS